MLLVLPVLLATVSCGPEAERLDLLLDPSHFPARDLAAREERVQVIAAARESGASLLRSFDPRETLRETLAILADRGVDVGPSAIVNFDSVEAWVPTSARRELERLPFLQRIRRPVAPVSTGLVDSQGVEITGADLAHATGAFGTGVSVAIVDKDYRALNATMGDAGDELPTLSTTHQWEQQSATGSNSTKFVNTSLEARGDREHGTAAAEVVYEMAPGVNLDLYRVKSTSGIEYAIRHAADRGVRIILVPLTHIETMGDPVGIPAGGKNRFTDDIDYAVARGSLVVVAAGNEANRHLASTYAPCAECKSSHPQYVCNTAADNSGYHRFFDGFELMPLNPLSFSDDEYDAGTFTLTCWSAIQSGFDPTKFKMQLFKYDEGSDDDEPFCPGDAGASAVSATERNLGDFFERSITVFDSDDDEQLYYLAVRYTTPGTPLANWPKFRIACGTGVEEFLFVSTPGSLSDLAVVGSALTVAEVDGQFGGDEVTDTSSRGPAASGPLKPDVAAPGIVDNFAVESFGFAFDGTFNGTSAAAAHVAGLAALMQGHRLAHGLPPLSPAAAKAWLQATAVDLEEAGPDPKVGAGLTMVPPWVLENAPGGPRLDQPGQALVAGNATTLKGVGFTAGSVIKLYVATATGAVSFGPYTPTAWSPTSLTWNVSSAIPLGNGFGSLQVINADEGYVSSNSRSQLLFGRASANIPTILTVKGVGLSPMDPSIPTANVEAIVAQGATVVLGGTGFNAPLVNLFTATGNVGPITPQPGGTSTQISIVIPPGTVTGPGSIQVVNGPYVGNVVSNAVSVPIGAKMDIVSIEQSGNTITVDGAGFSPLTVINFFAKMGSSVANFGGLHPDGSPKIPLDIQSSTKFAFQVPIGAGAGPAYVHALNPPYIPFSSTTGDPQGAFPLASG